jgi:hypothetical protein
MTDWMRARPKLTAALAGVVGLAVLMLVFVLASSGNKPSSKEPADFGAPLPTVPTRSPAKLPTTTPSPSTAAQVQAAAQNAFKQFGNQFGNGFSDGGLSSSQLKMPGLQGGSIYKYLPRHTVTMTASSEAPIGTVGYIVPTSLRKSSGIVKNVNTYWTLTTTAYGDPDYAQMFLQAGPRGFPITCTITVDGHTTEHRATEGPYGQLVCQG